MSDIEMNVGVQPLDAIMTEKEIKNHDLVEVAPPGFITHKQIQKGRKGRRLSMHLQDKVLDALNAFVAPESYEFKDLFNYRGKKPLD
jgi:oligoribonuclease (3'-5' exoribonuclease)